MTRNDFEEIERQSAFVAKVIKSTDSDETKHRCLADQFNKYLERHNVGDGPIHSGLIPPTNTKPTEHLLHPYFVSWCFFVSIPINMLAHVHQAWASRFTAKEDKQ